MQQERLTELITHAVEHVPFYRAWAATSGVNHDKLQLTDFPVVTKADIRKDVDAFQSDAYPVSEMRTLKTSGSSGEPFRFRTHAIASDYSYCCLWRALGRHGIRPGMRHAYIWGRSGNFATARRDRLKQRIKVALRDRLNSSLTLNAYDVTETSVQRMATAIQRFRPKYIHGYVSSLYLIARHLSDTNQAFGRGDLLGVVTESEKLYSFQREAISQAFQCPVLEHYGSVEFGNIAQTAPDGKMRINEDMFLIETNEAGEAIITNLLSTPFPFIRYKLGDIVKVSQSAPPPLPFATLEEVVGRTLDVIPLSSGGYLHGVSLAHVIDPHLEDVIRFQIHQASLDEFIIRMVCRDSMLPETGQSAIRSHFKRLTGDQTTVRFQFVDHIPAAASGKFRVVTSDIADIDLVSQSDS